MQYSDLTPVGDIVANNVNAAVVFEKYGIDYCCRGGVTLGEACKEKRLVVKDLCHEIASICQSSEPLPDFNNWPLNELTAYIIKKHHSYVREALPKIGKYLAALCDVHGARHPELSKIEALFDIGGAAMTHHMLKEEAILFPYIDRLVDATAGGHVCPRPPFGSVNNPIAVMHQDHTEEGERLQQISELTGGYQSPPDGCNTYRLAYAALADFERDLHYHIHLENNILFPKAVVLESALQK